MINVKLREVMAEYGRKHGVKLTYMQLSETTGISKAALEAIGSRPNYNTTLSVIDTLCKHLDCDISDLLVFRKD